MATLITCLIVALFSPTAPPWPTAGDGPDVAILEFEVLGPGQDTVPARLTFLNRDGSEPELFTNYQAAPTELAVRENVVYSKTGRGSITVPPGHYKIIASRGLEWSSGTRPMKLAAGQTAKFITRLRPIVDSTGWVSGDFHLHTLTHSGHGDSNLEERVITFLGEGLEFAVATDHNHNTDYHPTMAKLDIDSITAVTGNEVSVPIGHFNAFPLDPKRPVPPADSDDARKLFKLLRAEPNAYGVTPIIQVNHPRWAGIDYFGIGGMDPVTTAAAESWFSWDFDSIEVFNENAGWGYYDVEGSDPRNKGKSRYWALRDWFNLLNRGHRYAAVGNSDSHEVKNVLAGYPRNFVASSTDDASAIDVAEVAESIRKRRLFTTLGPFVEYWVDGQPMGSDVAATGGSIELRVKIQATAWVDCDRVKVVINGDVAHEIPVPQARRAVRLDTTVPVPLKHDAWLAVLVEGDDSLAPIVPDQDRPVRPLAVTNPVWIDVDGDGTWRSPWDQALEHVRAAPEPEKLASNTTLRELSASERGLLILAAAELDNPAATALIRRGLVDLDRVTRLSAARAAQRLASAEHVPDLDLAYRRNHDDLFMQSALLAAIYTSRPYQAGAMAMSFLSRLDAEQAARYHDTVGGYVERKPVRDWMVVGYFDHPEGTPPDNAFGPESDPISARTFDGRGGQVGWQRRTAEFEGYLDFKELGAEADHAAVYAQTYVYAPTNRTVRYALGTDDGCRMWHNGELVFEDPTPRSAHPFQKVGELELNNGTNRILVKVQNGRGSFGMYFQLFDDELIIVAKPASQ